MKPRPILLTALALTLPVWTLCAQDNPPPRPPDSGPRERGPRPDDGPRAAGPGRGQQAGGGLFSALDANHDGVIDAEEMSHAADVLRKFDRNGDGKITPDELRPGGDSQQSRRPQAENARPGNPRAEQPRREGDRGPRPDAGQRGPQPPEARPEQAPREGDRGRGPEARGPRHDGPDGRHDSQPPRREGSGAPSQSADGRQAQWQHHHHHHHGPSAPDGQRFAQGAPMPPWEAFRHGPQPWEKYRQQAIERRLHERYALAPQMNGFRPGPQPQAPPDYRRDARGPGQQDGPRDFRPPQWGPQRGGPAPAPQFGPGPQRFEQGQSEQRSQWHQSRHHFGSPQGDSQNSNQGPRAGGPDGGRPPMGPPPQGSGGGRPLAPDSPPGEES